MYSVTLLLYNLGGFMNSKQFLFLVVACASITTSMSAAVITQATEEEIAQAIMDREVAINDDVLYDGAVYTIAEFDVTTNGDYQRVTYKLEKPVEFINIVWAKDVVSVTVTDGTEPLYPTQKVKNDQATNDTRYVVDIYRYRTYTDNYHNLTNSIAGGTMLAFVGAYAYCLTKLAAHL